MELLSNINWWYVGIYLIVAACYMRAWTSVNDPHNPGFVILDWTLMLPVTVVLTVGVILFEAFLTCRDWWCEKPLKLRWIAWRMRRTKNGKALLEILQELAAHVYDGTQKQDSGICGNVYELTKRRNEDWSYSPYAQMMANLWVHWPLYSGNKSYPVPGDKKDSDPFMVFMKADKMWDGKYGRKRTELLYWMINQLK